jgi:tetratricopeptide (TPR) repeat protein
VLLERGRFYTSRSQPEKAEPDYAHAYALGSRDPKLIESIVGSEALLRRTIAESPGAATPLLAKHAMLMVSQSRSQDAAAELAEGVRLKPDDLRLHRELGACLLYSGDRAGWRRASATMLDRFGGAGAARAANDVAWACALGPGATPDPGVPVRLAEVALRDGPESFRDIYLNTLGAALYRAGRYDEAIRRLQEGIERRGGASLPEDWPFLAMAHHRLGHQSEARRWLDKLREHRPNESPDRFWDDLTIRLLRSEAEAVILYDPAFPDDPFAR